ncbi:MAG: alpha-galactosidase [Clostridia bacterium]|nr:alpha-galactosidase [Clostridia bacterium]
MKTIDFGELMFCVSDDSRLLLTKCFGCDNTHLTGGTTDLSICEFDIAGGSTSGSNHLHGSKEARKLRYVSHCEDGNTLTIIQRSDIAEVTSVFTKYDNTNAVRVTQTVKNLSDEPMCLELANTVGIHFAKDAMAENKDWYFHKFTNARYTEALPDVRSLFELGMQWKYGNFRVKNYGNASSSYNLPQGILENRVSGDHLMFQIESYHDWFYEITVKGKMFTLQIGGPSANCHQWNKVLVPGQSYTTVPVALAGGKSLNAVLAEMTKYRRYIIPHCEADKHLPSIYNEYMHFSWDDPNAARVHMMAPYVAASGCEYYVVDCGWHDSKEITKPLGMYNKFGTWYEDKGRFPDGIRATAEYVRSLGMKFGLWIAPEVVGNENFKMLEYYDDECFFTRNGKKIASNTGYLLDFRNPKVYDYMSKTLDRMIDEYGCDYIKFDGCPNAGFGTELDCTSPGDGLEKAYEAFLAWTKNAMERHPNVIFEDCAGGGQRMDYRALSIFNLISTSDQTSYAHYPYIAGNITASVLPEQAAVWSYPVDSALYDPENEDKVNERVTKERVVINMINALLGRIHLASRFHLLDEEKRALIKEGIDMYNRMTPDKLQAVPYLPKGYCMFGDTLVAAGLKTDSKVYLAVWNLNGERHVKLPLPEITVKDVEVAYPVSLETKFTFDDSSLTVDFTENEQARLFEITLK